MSRKRRKRDRVQKPETPPVNRRVPVWVIIAVTVVITATVTFYFTSCFTTIQSKPVTLSINSAKYSPPLPPLKKYTRKIKELENLYKIPVEPFIEADIAELNLICAEELPGAENIDIDRCLARLDEWALRVQFETHRHLYRVKDPRFAEHYHHSESYYRVEMLIQVLQEDCGIKYNPERIRDVDFTNSKDLFIYGMIDDKNGGTCASIPVLYVAVGRRLGYPMFLVRAKGHLFARWDDGKDRFNIEGAGSGFTSYPDSYYENWPHPLTEGEKKSGFFLKSLTPQQELSVFFASRGHCLSDTDRLAAAVFTYIMAEKFDLGNPIYRRWCYQVRDMLDVPTRKKER